MKLYTENTLTTLVVIITTSLVFADQDSWLPTEVSNPRSDPDGCGRTTSSYICDPNNLIDQSDVSQLDALIEEVREEEPCLCSTYYCTQLNNGGAKIAIAIVAEMTTEEEARGEAKPKYQLNRKLNDAAEFSQYLHEAWNLDNEDCGDGIFIFYSAKDHVLYTHTGTATTRVLKNFLISEISMNHRFLFEKGEYFEGFANLINDYKGVLQGTYRSRVHQPVQPPESQALLGSTAADSLAPLRISILMVIATLLLHL